MGHDVTWDFHGSNSSWLGEILSSAPYFKRINDPYYEYYSPDNKTNHPDAIALITQDGIEFTDFGDPKILSEVMKFLNPKITSKCGKVLEKF